MIKNLKYIAIALATLFVACDDDDYTDWADPQSNEPEALQTASFSVSYDENYVFDLADIEEGAESVQLFTPVTAVEAGATDFTYKVILSAEGNKIEIAADENGYVKVADLQAAIESIYGKAPETREVSATVYCYFTLNGVTYRCSNTASIPVVQVQLDAPIIENTYYLIGNYVGGGWNADGLLEFNHSSSDVYEDPVFTVTFEVIEAETGNDNSGSAYIKVVPQSAYDETANDLDWDAMLVLPDGVDRVFNDYTDGFTAPLVVATEAGDNTIEVDDPGKYRVTINMMDYTISIEQLGNFEDFIYVPGTYNWDPVEGCARIGCTDGNGYYTGFAVINTNFKISAYDWDAANSWAFNYGYSSFISYSGVDMTNDSGNIGIVDNCATDIMYYVEADCVNMGLFVIEANICIIGSINDDTSWSIDYPMTLVSRGDDGEHNDEPYLTAEVEVQTGGAEFKFYGGNEDEGGTAWNYVNIGGLGTQTLNIDGTTNTLNHDGQSGNLKIETAGKYIVNLYPTRVTKDDIYCTVTPVE